MTTDLDPAAASTGDLSRLRIHRDARPGRRWIAWVVLLASLGLAGVFAWPRARAYWALRQAPEVDIVVARRLEVAPGAGASAIPVLVASGYVIARHSTDVGVKTGGRLAWIGIEEGDRVRAGEVIARIEHADLEAGLDAARAVIRESEAGVAQAIATRDEDRRAEDRQIALRKEGIASEATLTAAGAAAAASAARVRSYEAALETNRARLRVIEESIENTNVRAPFSGVVIRKRAEVGETVSQVGVAGQASREAGAIATIADLSELEVQTEVSESSVAKVRQAMMAEVKVQAVPDAAFHGRVRQVFPTADRAKAIVEVRVSLLDPDARVKPEMTATVTFQEPRTDSAATATEARVITLIPKRAVIDQSGRPSAWVVSGGKAMPRALTLGADELEWVEVRSGIAPGESVIVNPPGTLTGGQPVRLKTAGSSTSGA